MSHHLPETSKATSRTAADRIRRQMADRVRDSAAHPSQLNDRLRELDREWGLERALATGAAVVSLGGLALASRVDRRFLALPGVIGGFLLQHGLMGWCPPSALLRRRGYRTQAEIQEERAALKALRGDFQLPTNARVDSPAMRAEYALQSAGY